MGLEVITSEFPILLTPAETLNLEGIYTLAENKLTYCIASKGVPRPTSFSAAKGSKCTLISLERFPPGERTIEATLKQAGAFVAKNEEGWIVRLWVDNCNDALAAEIGQLQKLKLLSIKKSGPSTEQGWRTLGQLESLQRLVLNGLPITDAAIAQISKSKSLEFLSMQGAISTDHANTVASVTDDGLLELGKLKSLRRLIVSQGQFTADTLSHLQTARGPNKLIVQQR